MTFPTFQGQCRHYKSHLEVSLEHLTGYIVVWSDFSQGLRVFIQNFGRTLFEVALEKHTLRCCQPKYFTITEIDDVVMIFLKKEPVCISPISLVLIILY